MRNMTQETLDILTAPGPLAFDQDPLAVGGRRVRLDPSGRYDTWARPLADGTFAALVFDRGPEARQGATWPHPLCPEDERATTPPSARADRSATNGARATAQSLSYYLSTMMT